MSWRDYAKQVQAYGHNRHDWHDSGPDAPFVPNVPNVPGAPPLDPARAIKLCDKGLAGVAPAKPLHGIEPDRWRQILDDAQWVRDAFAPAAFRNGWTVGDLFGLWWFHDGGGLARKDGYGGISDRLQGARSIVMDEHRASWRRMFTGEPDTFARGTYHNLRPLWEAPE